MENLTVVPKSVEEAYEEMDRLDESSIVQDIQCAIDKKTADILFYTFPVKGKVVEGLSKNGVDELRRYLAQEKGIYIRDTGIIATRCPVDPENYVVFTATVSQFRLTPMGIIEEGSAIGAKRQCVFIETRSGISAQENKFWYEAGSMKAIRNAVMRLIPARLKLEYLEMLKLQAKSKQTAQRRYCPTTTPPTATPPTATPPLSENPPTQPGPSLLPRPEPDRRNFEQWEEFLERDTSWIKGKFSYSFDLLIPPQRDGGPPEVTGKKTDSLSWQDACYRDYLCEFEEKGEKKLNKIRALFHKARAIILKEAQENDGLVVDSKISENRIRMKIVLDLYEKDQSEKEEKKEE